VSGGERGLLGIAVDPAFAENHHIYLYYTHKVNNTCDTVTNPANRVARFTLDDDDEADDTPITGEVLETSALVDSRTGYVVGESNGKTAKIYDDAKLVTNEQAAQALAEFPEAETKFDTLQPTSQAKPEDGGRKAFDDYCESRNLPEFKRFALLNSAGGDYVTALEFAKKVK
jgi:hypothetical protein